MPNWYCRNMTTIQVPKVLALFTKRLECARPAGTEVLTWRNGNCLIWELSSAELPAIIDKLQMFILKEAALVAKEGVSQKTDNKAR